jgi:2,4-dienoyl-CoA reductase-like NADH-dependent reductase (Old Yellow Enzyme family)
VEVVAETQRRVGTMFPIFVRLGACDEYAGGATIDAADIAVTIVALPDGTAGVRVVTSNAVVPAGLYVGVIESADQQPLAPVHLYVSRAEGQAQ